VPLRTARNDAINIVIDRQVAPLAPEAHRQSTPVTGIMIIVRPPTMYDRDDPAISSTLRKRLPCISQRDLTIEDSSTSNPLPSSHENAITHLRVEETRALLSRFVGWGIFLGATAIDGISLTSSGSMVSKLRASTAVSLFKCGTRDGFPRHLLRQGDPCTMKRKISGTSSLFEWFVEK